MKDRSLKCHLIHLGLTDYETAWDIQRRLAEARAAGQIADTLLLLEHPHTYTLGRAAHIEHLLMSEAERARRGVKVIHVDRGGDITYHGPGQLVAYPIRYLGQPDPTGRLVKADYVGYIRSLEEVLIRTLAPFGLQGYRVEGYTGVWVEGPSGPEKIAAIGVRVNARGISTHGAALNVTTDLTYFRGIIPCGISDRAVTSMQALLGERTPPMREVIASFEAAFAGVFGCELIPARLGELVGAS